MTGRLRLLKDSLVNLASAPERQLAYLQGLEVPVGVDELALEYDDIAPAAVGMLHDGELNENQLEFVQQLRQMLKRMSGAQNSHLWTEEALRTAQEWRDVRQVAARCLEHFQTGLEEKSSK